ncbi:uncharacterized protein [Dermacentor albipictus]|uniref:uncharacterized protein n=1 Tax=Dermacentor albipictus TaxID=60249 RepID=UPI0038FC9C90
MKSLAEGSILFTRKFHTSSELRPIAENYEGIFLKKQRNVMQLREPGHNFMAKETILYHSERYHCAVIKVTPTLRGDCNSHQYRCAFGKPRQSLRARDCTACTARRFVWSSTLL